MQHMSLVPAEPAPCPASSPGARLHVLPLKLTAGSVVGCFHFPLSARVYFFEKYAQALSFFLSDTCHSLDKNVEPTNLRFGGHAFSILSYFLPPTKQSPGRWTGLESVVMGEKETEQSDQH